jgi:hypothetical protein
MAAMPEEVQAAVRSFLELSPGTPASDKNLQKMFQLIATVQTHRRFSVSSATLTVARPMVAISLIGTKKKPEFVFDVYESALLEENGMHQEQQTHPIFRNFQPATHDGLREGLREAKAALVNLARGFCERCSTLESPRKRLKTSGMAACTECSIAAALGF